MRRLATVVALIAAASAGCRSRGSATAPDAGAPVAPAAPVEVPQPSCAAIVPHVIDLLTSSQGSDAMLSRADVPALVKGCDAAGNLDARPGDARCVMAANDLTTASRCNLDLLLQGWVLKAAPVPAGADPR